MNDVITFSKVVDDVAKKYEINVLKDYSKQMFDAIEAFDIDSILKLVKQYGSFVNDK